MKILIVEDSLRLLKSLEEGFKQQGFIVDTTSDGKEALHMALTDNYSAIVLDIMLPGMDGLSVLRKIRDKKNATNIIILSAKVDIDDRIIGLKIGADDYLCKPFSFEELLARVNTIIRRSCNVKSDRLELRSGLLIDLSIKKILKDNVVIPLTPIEYSLLEAMAINRGRVLSYSAIENQVYDIASNVTKNAIEAHVSTMRRKLKNHQVEDLVLTRRGFGYYIENE